MNNLPCFCGENHNDIYVDHKCLECSYNSENLLHNWLRSNTIIPFVHNYTAYCLRSLNGNFLPLQFHGGDFLIEIEDIGCTHKPHNNLVHNCFYDENENFHCSHSENRYKLNLAIGQNIRNIIKIPREMCNERNFHKIDEAFELIRMIRLEDSHSPIIILIKNGQQDERYNYINYFSDRTDIKIEYLI
jgi:hypothetical protein